MKLSRLAPFFALVLTLGQGPSAFGQGTRAYVDFGIEPKYVEKLQALLKREDDLEPFKDLVKQVLADPKMLGLDPAKFKDMKFDEKPELRRAVEDWVRHDKGLQDSLRHWIKQQGVKPQTPDTKKLHKDLEGILDRSGENAPNPPTKDGPEWKGTIRSTRPKEADYAKLTKQALKQAENTQLSRWLENSPAWQRAFEDLSGSMNQPEAPPGMMDDWPGNLLLPEGGPFKLAEGALERFRDRPRFQRLNWEVKVPGIGNFTMPDFGAPGTGDLSGTSFSSLGPAATWLLLAVITVLVGWRLWHWARRTSVTAKHRADLGPWPVRPDAVATRADLIQAFDYLALWTLGLSVRSWNHQAVARRWRERAPACAETAQALAKLYEQARYTRGAEPLADAERELAQRALAQIAEAL